MPKFKTTHVEPQRIISTNDRGEIIYRNYQVTSYFWGWWKSMQEV